MSQYPPQKYLQAPSKLQKGLLLTTTTTVIQKTADCHAVCEILQKREGHLCEALSKWFVSAGDQPHH
ncbi:hypothetical protein PCASD_26101 [Puccinia coronata f. sp. avenae]|uniref:Uncharacterized protein n=1 Tax=Puccinia coronata f. sp. avenae TaxID=200324 RepID=A0A2N5SA77_9BASI|nr:hypothetical protein PCASD_26101 [Puccinia coronata f. sp. avenae]